MKSFIALNHHGSLSSNSLAALACVGVSVEQDHNINQSPWYWNPGANY